MHRRTRPGFTLIELLVVIALISVIATLIVLVGPSLFKKQAASEGARRLQGGLFVAKQQALRDRSPYGIRLIPDPNNPLYVTSFVYIVQPEPIVGRPDNLLGGQLQYVQNQPTQVQIYVDLTGGQSLPSLYLVQPGDVLQIQGGTSFLIQSVQPPSQTQPYSLVTVAVNPPLWTVAPPLGPPVSATSQTYNWTITRYPRPATGLDAVQFPSDVIIDMSLSRPPTSPDPYYDIVFTPSGQVVGNIGANNGKIILWVRDSSQDPDQPGDQTLVTVFTRSGLIAAFPVDLGGLDPYSFTRDPRSSGL